jgi:hypothetical protein
MKIMVRPNAFRQQWLDWRNGQVRPVRSLVCLAVFAALPLAAGISQIQQNGGLPGVEHNSSGMAGLPDVANPHPDGVRALRDSMQMQENRKRWALLNVQRQKEMTSDTARLLELANEVKTDTEKSGKDTLFALEVHKVEQIEKLARTVREKMKANYTE